MKRQVIAIALGSLVALPAFADVESGLELNEIQPGLVLPVSQSGKTREDVRAELIAAQQAGDVIANAEMGTTLRRQAPPAYRTDTMADSAPARSEYPGRL